MSKYDENSIERFAGLAGIRKKPTPYIGPTDGDGLWTIFREPADNCVDQALAGRNTSVNLIIDSAPNTYWVVDSGEGIPVGVKSFENERGVKEKLSTLYVVTGLTHGGSNFSGDTISRGCFTGDTRIRLLNNKVVTMEQLYKRWSTNQDLIPVMSFDLKAQKLQPSNISHVQITKRTRDLVKVRLDGGDFIKCTPDHPFYVNRGGSIRKVRADRLETGDSLVSTYHGKDKDGYLTQTEQGVRKYTHRVVGHYYNDCRLGIDEVHHVHRVIADNRPSNLEILTKAKHQEEHSESRSISSRRKILEEQADLRMFNSLKFQDQNNDEDFIKVSHTTKAIRIGVRAIVMRGSFSKANYESVRSGTDLSWDRAVSYFDSKSEFRKAVVARHTYLLSRKDLSLVATRELSENQSIVSPSDKSQHANWVKSVATWARALLVLEDPDSATPHEFNFVNRTGAVVFGRYATMRRFTSLKWLKAHVLSGEPLRMHDDLSEEAQQSRMFDAEIRMRTPMSLQKMLKAFHTTLRLNPSVRDEESYSKAKPASAPQWKFALRILFRKHGTTDLDSWVSTFNHTVQSVNHIRLQNAVPVYDITVDNTHVFFLEPGVLVSNTHGLGIKATNAMSKTFTVWTHRDGDWHCIEYRDAKLHKDVHTCKAPKLPHGLRATKGTVVCFSPDLSLFQKSAKINPQHVLEWCSLTSYLVKGLKVTLTNSKGKSKTFTTGGPADYITDKIAALKTTQMGKTFIFSGKEVDVALAFTDCEGLNVNSYTNGLFNKEGGEHQRALVDALMKSLTPFKGKLNFTKADIVDGLLGLINYKISAPQFNNQPKDKLVDDRVYAVAFPMLTKAWEDFWAKNKGMAKDVVSRAALLRSKTQDFLKDKKLVKNVNTAKKSLSTKLAAIQGKAPINERELILVEGDSAGGGAKRVRDKFKQAIYPLKGKPLNVMETAKDKINNNTEVVGLLAALDVDLSGKVGNVPYGKVICMADADVDGNHINVLLMGLLYTYLPRLFEEGKIFVVKSPLFKARYKNKVLFGMTKEELHKKAGTTKLDITYLKGWGELSESDLGVALDPGVRTLYQVMPPDKAGSANFKLLLGKDSKFRKKLLGVE